MHRREGSQHLEKKDLHELVKPKNSSKGFNMLASNNQYFYGKERPDSGRSNAISEIDMNSEKSAGAQKESMQVRARADV